MQLIKKKEKRYLLRDEATLGCNGRKRFYISHDHFRSENSTENGHYFYVRFFHSLRDERKKKKKKQSTNAFEFTHQACLIDVGWCIFFFFHVDHFFRENVQ